MHPLLKKVILRAQMSGRVSQEEARKAWLAFLRDDGDDFCPSAELWIRMLLTIALDPGDFDHTRLAT